MSDIRHVLDRTATWADAPPSPDTVDADLERGRADATRRRRRRRAVSAIGTLAAAGILGGSLALSGSLGQGSTPQTDSQAGSQAGSQTEGVALIAYKGDQPDGFVVDQVPEGWFIQGSRPQALTIAEEGDTTHPDSFEDKLVVALLSSSAEQVLPKGDPVEVNGNPGVVRNHSHGGGKTLIYDDGEGHLVEVQAWETLGWSNDRLVDFAEGVEVTADVAPTVG